MTVPPRPELQELTPGTRSGARKHASGDARGLSDRVRGERLRMECRSAEIESSRAKMEVGAEGGKSLTCSTLH
ncbi:hypothetical protein SKAU_G00045900 [Synaphobranchus kaupii]|uniref:Uncharacterized protein n=1 Tax=Synaphobranchus kaupii TaxID=118154 RepID=A0A9Q1J996_SYNKA|nr:hypothetical protein SKAU_G00045900 [Synaphobranchus kaupii]